MGKVVERVCEYCNTTFPVEQKEVNKGRGKFCGRSCKSKYYHYMKPQDGKSNPNWKGGRTSDPYNSYVKRYKEYNRKKANTHRKVMYAVQQGQLIKEPCEVCGDVNSEAHHDDYDKPLEVRWLCRKHHNELHRQAIEDQREEVAEVA